jgi:hypothetical protein
VLLILRSTNIPHRALRWQEAAVFHDVFSVQDAGDEATNAQFAKAMALTGAEFLDCVDYITHVSRIDALRLLLSAVVPQGECAPQCWLPELCPRNVGSLS